MTRARNRIERLERRYASAALEASVIFCRDGEAPDDAEKRHRREADLSDQVSVWVVEFISAEHDFGGQKACL